MGPNRTVPPDRRATPRAGRALDNDLLELDRPPATPPEPSAPEERWPLRPTPLNGIRDERDLTADLLTPEPLPHHAEVVDRRLQPPEPLGRRAPEPLDASREGVER